LNSFLLKKDLTPSIIVIIGKRKRKTRNKLSKIPKAETEIPQKNKNKGADKAREKLIIDSLSVLFILVHYTKKLYLPKKKGLSKLSIYFPPIFLPINHPIKTAAKTSTTKHSIKTHFAGG